MDNLVPRRLKTIEELIDILTVDCQGKFFCKDTGVYLNPDMIKLLGTVLYVPAIPGCMFRDDVYLAEGGYMSNWIPRELKTLEELEKEFGYKLVDNYLRTADGRTVLYPKGRFLLGTIVYTRERDSGFKPGYYYILSC